MVGGEDGMTFDIEVAHPIPGGELIQGLGGPFVGTHTAKDDGSDHWYIVWGNDLGAPGGTEVCAPFDATLSRVTPHVPTADSDKVFGAQLFMRGKDNKFGAFFTHLTEVPENLVPGYTVAQGDLLGRVMDRGEGSHVHLALVEILGGVLDPANYKGVSLYDQFTTMDATSLLTVTFHEDGTPPTVV
jgi:hypothetical protein